MSKPLIIAEKPAAARAIAEALGGFAARTGYLESPNYRLTWALGHLVEQLAPEDYDGRWKRWTMEALPILPVSFGVKVVQKSRSQFDVVAALMQAATELINACDAGREGELIFRYICQAANVHRPVRRLWISSLTQEAIRKGFSSLRPQFEYDRLYQSALCRAQGDWLVGMNATRAFTLKWGELLSVGRVQTPTLALIVRRELEIESFVPEQYWEVHAEFLPKSGRSYRGKWFGADGDRIKSAEEAQAVAERVAGQTGAVESAEERLATERPPQLFDLTTLQREANRRLGLTAAATLKTAQSLYEAKLITYPRTDSRYLTRDMLRELPAVVRSVGRAPGLQALAAGASLGLVNGANRRVIDDAKVTDHHAIIPTPEAATGLTGVSAKVYDLIARRFLAQFYPEAQDLETEIITCVGNQPDRFRSRGRRTVEPGWRVVEPPAQARKKGKEEGEEPLSPLPLLQAGEGVRTQAVEVQEKKTEPPRRYTEARLLAAMETAGKEMAEEALKEAMKGRGLGTPATRAAIIERLKEVGYIALEKKALVPTMKGRQLVERAEAAGAQVLLQAELTGDWEKRIADIQAGTFEPDRFMAQIRDFAVLVVEKVRSSAGGAAPVRRSRTGAAPAAGNAVGPVFTCPRCGGAVVKGSKGWACSAHACNVRIPGYLCGKVVDAELARALLQRGKSSLVSGFTSPRTGKLFSAYLVLKDGEIGFEFPTTRKPRASGYRRSETTAAQGAAPKKSHAAPTKANRARQKVRG